MDYDRTTNTLVVRTPVVGKLVRDYEDNINGLLLLLLLLLPEPPPPLLLLVGLHLTDAFAALV